MASSSRADRSSCTDRGVSNGCHVQLSLSGTALLHTSKYYCSGSWESICSIRKNMGCYCTSSNSSHPQCCQHSHAPLHCVSAPGALSVVAVSVVVLLQNLPCSAAALMDSVYQQMSLQQQLGDIRMEMSLLQQQQQQPPPAALLACQASLLCSAGGRH